MNDMQIWTYRTQGGPLIPFPIDPRTPDGERCDVIDLATHRPEHHWVGYVVCIGCDYGFVGILVLESAEATPPRRLRCPRCRCTNAVPVVHWAASCEAHCGGCGKIWREIYHNPETAPDILPKRLQCRRCGVPTRDIRPWPLQD